MSELFPQPLQPLHAEHQMPTCELCSCWRSYGDGCRLKYSIVNCRCEACCRGDADPAAEAAQVGLRCTEDGCDGAVVLPVSVTQLTSLHDVPAGWLPEQCTR